jgi:hypothetical protein
MSHEDDDVLEIGDDGAFDIPIPASKPKTIPYSSVDVAENENDGISTPSISLKTVFESIQPGEYKIYKSDQLLTIVIRLGENISPVNYALGENILVIELSNKKFLRISLPQKVKQESSEAKFFGDYVVFKISE